MKSIKIVSLMFVLLILPGFGQSIGAKGEFGKTTVRAKSDRKKESSIAGLEKLIPRLISVGEVPGLSIALIKNGEIFWHRNFGVKNAETHEPIGDDTVFEAASLSKPVFAYAVMKLVDEGKLDLDTPLSKYLAELPVQNDERAAFITARMVLSHTTGFQNESTPTRPLKIYFRPGEKFSYSGAGFLYLQKVVEHLTGEALETLIKRTVFDPLQMMSSSFVWQERYEKLKANGHKPSGAVSQIRKPTVAWAYSTLHTTISDYAKFVIAVMNSVGLKKKLTEEMLKMQVKVDESCFSCLERNPAKFSNSLSWGLGWGLETVENRQAFWHWGDNNSEYHNFVMAYAKEKTALIIFTNSGNGHSVIPEIVFEAMGGSHPAFAWMGYEPYNSPAKILYRDIIIRGTTAIAQYREARGRSSGATALNEEKINDIGYWLLGKKRTEEAIGIFKLNTEHFPNSSNAYDSLGEAYMVNDNMELATKNYQKSLELNPNNTNAAAMLKRLQK